MCWISQQIFHVLIYSCLNWSTFNLVQSIRIFASLTCMDVHWQTSQWSGKLQSVMLIWPYHYIFLLVFAIICWINNIIKIVNRICDGDASFCNTQKLISAMKKTECGKLSNTFRIVYECQDKWGMILLYFIT